MKRDIHLERTYPHPPELVWRVLTDPQLLAEWLMPNDFRPEVGHHFTMRSEPQPGWDGVVALEVLELEPLRRMRWSWKGGPIDTTVTFLLERTGSSGTILRLEHTGFERLPPVLVSFILDAGWRRMLRDALPAILDRVSEGRDAADTPGGKPGGLWRVLARIFAPILRRTR